MARVLSDESDDGIDEMDSGRRLIKLINLGFSVQWEVERDRHRFLRKLYPLVRNWERNLPDLLRIFRSEQIDRLLWDAVTCTYASRNPLQQSHIGQAFFQFVANCDYRDRPRLDQNGRISRHRTTVIHHAIHKKCDLTNIEPLFDIFDEYDVNYTDGSGLTHFHVACMTGKDEVVERFLESDPLLVNLCHARTGDSPLHVALHNFKNDTARLLLRRGANPNLRNARGETPLHVASKSPNDGHVSIGIFFEVIRELGLAVMIDARDRSGWTPLQCAVANALPDTVQVLLDHGADRSGFTFPTESHLLVSLQPEPDRHHRERYILLKAAGLLESITKISREGEKCILVQKEAILVMSLFARYRWFETREDLESRWYDEEAFQQDLRVVEAMGELPRIVINEEMSLSLNDLIRLRPDDATAKLLTYRHYFDMGLGLILLDGYDGLLARNLCEKMARNFFLSYARAPFYELTHYRLPPMVCEMILEWMTNEDLYHVCLAGEMIRERKKVGRTDRCGAIKRRGVAGERRRKILDRNGGALRSRLEKLRNVQKSYS